MAKQLRQASSGLKDTGSVAPVTGGCTCFYLRSATRRVTQIYDDMMRDSGIGVNQYSILSHIAHREGLTLSEFADVMSMDRTTLTRNLKPLVAASLVKVNAPDLRSRTLSLTRAGRLKLEAAFPLWQAAQIRVNALLGEEQQVLHAALKHTLSVLKTASPVGA